MFRPLLGSLGILLIVSIIAMTVAPASAQICDEGQIKPCGSNIGKCKEGVQRCQGGEWSECFNDIEPEREICGNEIDEDCDGAVDECVTSIWTIMILVGVLMLFVMFMLIKMGF